MFPTISDLLRELFNIHIPLPIQTFGFMLAFSFFCAAWTLSIELRRKEKLGLFKPVTVKTLVGEPAKTSELLYSFLIGFVIGYKLLYVVMNYDDFVNDTQGMLLSGNGSFLGGILFGIGSAAMRYYEKQKSRLEKPVWRSEEVSVANLVGNITMVAAIAGILGAKIFHNLENIDDLIQDPIGALISFSGLTMYGGLICGGAAVLWYARKNGMDLFHMADSAAPGLMLAYGTGRMGCHLSGDGDWGIVNLAPKPDWLGFLPDWFWSYNYPHNVINEGVRMIDCVGNHCMVLPEPVFPTPLYESLACIMLFAVLWSLRKKIAVPGMLFCIYLVMNGAERFLIEKIRVNTKYHFGSLDITQAEIISLLLFVLGVVGVIWLKRKTSDK
ncbi:MAG: prolipoprotein diacylglyceryl transferase [Bacteroidota bacterium]